MTIINRALAPTPRLFKILRAAGLALLAVSGGLLGAPIALPAALVSIAGYTAVRAGYWHQSARSRWNPNRNCPKKEKRMENNSVLRNGTISGTVLGILPGIFCADILKTMLLAVVGAVTSFLITLFMKWLLSKKKR